LHATIYPAYMTAARTVRPSRLLRHRYGAPGGMMPPHLWRCTGLRGRGGRLGRCLLAETLGLVPTGRLQEAAAQEIEVRAAEHLAFHHFQAVDVPLDRAGTPRQGDAGFDRCIVLAEPARKALEGLQRTGRRAREPGIEAR